MIHLQLALTKQKKKYDQQQQNYERIINPFAVIKFQ